MLTDDCGHHCGVITTSWHQHIGHCPCSDCHDQERCRFRILNVKDKKGFGPRCTKKAKHDSPHVFEKE